MLKRNFTLIPQSWFYIFPEHSRKIRAGEYRPEEAALPPGGAIKAAGGFADRENRGFRRNPLQIY
jgi:hypothetical protein